MKELYLSILERLEIIRAEKRLNKAQFEKVLGKSTGYVNTLKKNKSIPGTEVMIKLSEYYPEYNIEWLLTGEGEKLKGADKSGNTESKKGKSDNLGLETVRDEIRSDLKIILDGMTTNFEVINEGILQGLKGQQKVLKFIDQLNADDINGAAKNLNKFLEEHKE